MSAQTLTYPEPKINKLLFASKYSVPFWTVAVYGCRCDTELLGDVPDDRRSQVEQIIREEAEVAQAAPL